MSAEKTRLLETRYSEVPWKKWGPYLSERQWGTVREDYSPDGSAWQWTTFEKANLKAYRWGEDGIAGISDEKQQICFASAFWNHKDSILKERLFGLSGLQGNHGEDVKEVYYHLDNTPTHSYMKYLYKYPQEAFPYELLIQENKKRAKTEREFELMDTGIFNEDRYFDIFVEYAKASPTDILIRISAHNRGPDAALLDIVPQIWFRDVWTGSALHQEPKVVHGQANQFSLTHPSLAREMWLQYDGTPQILCCNNRSNQHVLYGGSNENRYTKDGVEQFILHGVQDAVNPKYEGTKGALRYSNLVPSEGVWIVQLRLSEQSYDQPFLGFDQTLQQRTQEADAFYNELQANVHDEDARWIQRQAFAGMLWNKQYYHYDVSLWLNGDHGAVAPPSSRLRGRNHQWTHVRGDHVISMPDKWEYPWFAAWDLAFHCIPLARLDAAFAKEQLELLTTESFMHPTGQLPAYEWGFGDVNPPVQAWAAWRVYCIDRERNAHQGDLSFLERLFHKLVINFSWWVNRKDSNGNNIFEGGFLGLDNIGLFDRRELSPLGGILEQADATSWMAMFSLNMLRISLELAQSNPVYQELAIKYFDHFLTIARAMVCVGGDNLDLWHEEDQFYYDVIHRPHEPDVPLRVRSMVGLLPLIAVETIEASAFENVPRFQHHVEETAKRRPDLAQWVSRWYEPGRNANRLFSLLRGHRLKALLRRMLSEQEFLSPFGIRALSREHAERPYRLRAGDLELEIGYLPGESDSNMFGGNSNWRGPIWFPLNYMIVESLRAFYEYYGDGFKVEYPTGSGEKLDLRAVGAGLKERLTHLYLRNMDGQRPFFGHHLKMQSDPHFRDHLLFYEYFHGDNGAGLGASHQTGWTGLIAELF